MEAQSEEEHRLRHHGDLPSAEEVLRDLEEHLRRLKSDSDKDPEE
jgi:hypothetical protein